MSIDTIAIMLTVLVGAVGYAMQAYIAQRAERSSEEAAQQLNVHEREREREHRMAVAQVSRTCCCLRAKNPFMYIFVYYMHIR